ncbi:hypothetical protein [Actinoallomurus iriomotensis]|uniref:Uncharacterized protein n=1 Tax=Actinoallomurus iriomotensis TaxID=478107 RepID=A0A9W6RUF4_9ACTN|nr:hypothetical protein [Actinoallomurus iriomotensis]GLY81883.1 hypothetical protein Airi01_101500 [Actinoallomurus iriomotensis]
MTAAPTPQRSENVEQILASLQIAELRGGHAGLLTKGEVDLVSAVHALVRHRLGERGGVNDDVDLHELGCHYFERGVQRVKAELKPVRHTAPIVRVHADNSPCTHAMSPNGKPKPGQGCPGPAGYVAKCKAPGCSFESSAGIRAIVEDVKKTHLQNPAASR